MLQITKRGIVVEQRKDEYIITIVTAVMNSFGEIKTSTKHFDTVREYALKQTIQQAKNLYPVINC